ncbi:MAG: TatD family hydrolase [Catalinimonas sp.]
MLNAPLIDTHAHVYAERFEADRDAVTARAKAAGVARVYLPNVDRASVAGMLTAERADPDFYRPMMGLHPCSVKADFEEELAEVENWLNRRSFVAVGEIGTDLYWDQTFREQQAEAFRVQVGWAKARDLPVVIHCRESIDWTLALLEPFADARLRGIFHCFTGTVDQAQRAVALGFRLGVGGVVTFKNGGLDRVLPHVDPDALVLETDSPYLAPTPHRGKRNEPAYVALVAVRLAELLGESVENTARRTTRTAEALFNPPSES